MVNLAVARRYARALFELATERGLVDQMDRELETVVTLIEANRPLHAMVHDVLIAPEAKRDVFEKLFTGKVSPLVMNFLLLVIAKRREAGIAEMYRAFLDLANEARGIVEVEVRSAVALPEETAQRLEGKLVAKLGKRVRFKTQVVPELIGGMVVRVGDELMDGSVRSRLRRMHNRLISARPE